MKISAPGLLRRSVLLAVMGVLVAVLTACTGRGGGQLPPDKVLFNGAASFGFSFSCEDKGGINPQTGQLHIQLAYSEKGTYLPLGTLPLGKPFGIHGIVDVVDPVLESAVCIGQEPPPGGNELIFLGRYRTTTSAPAGLSATCRTQSTPTCRFEVTVRDNDNNLRPSTGDYFQIKLSNITALTSEFPKDPDPAIVPYIRAGLLSSGNLTVN
jgi:hypothetical protein